MKLPKKVHLLLRASHKSIKSRLNLHDVVFHCLVKEHKVVFPILAVHAVQCFPGASHFYPRNVSVNDNVLASITTLAVAGLAASADSKNHRIASRSSDTRSVSAGCPRAL